MWKDTLNMELELLLLQSHLWFPPECLQYILKCQCPMLLEYNEIDLFSTTKLQLQPYSNSTKRWQKKLQSFSEIVDIRICPICCCDWIVLWVNALFGVLIYCSLIHLPFNEEKNGERERFFPTRIHQFLVRLHLSVKMRLIT